MYTWSMFVSLIGGIALQIMPLVGLLLIMVLMPVVTLLTMSACRTINAGQTIVPTLWFKPLQQTGLMKKLVLMGLLYFVLVCVASAISAFIFMDGLLLAMQEAIDTNQINILYEALLKPMLLMSAFYVLIGALFWYTPVLVAWHGVQLGQALFFSAVACWRNKWVFLVYGAGWMLVPLSIYAATLGLQELGLSPFIANALQMPVSIAALGVFYCSLYPSYTTVFGIDNAGAQFDNSNGPQT